MLYTAAGADASVPKLFTQRAPVDDGEARG